MPTACRPEELFSLDLLAGHLLGFQPPQGPHDPAGDWQFGYRLYSLALQLRVGGSVGSRVGTVRLRRQRRGADVFALQVECEKPAPGRYFARLAAEVEARTVQLPVPLRWSWQGEIVDPDAKPISRLKRSATLQASTLELDDARRKLAVSGPCTINWLLFEAVGRLPREPFSPLSFMLLDDFDQPKPGHTLRYAHSTTVMLGEREQRQTRIEELEKGRIHKTAWVRTPGQPVRLHVYHHFGDGIVPWLYWVDDQGRLLFAVSGLEAYVLDSFFPASPGPGKRAEKGDSPHLC
jgi:hypothetical protein